MSATPATRPSDRATAIFDPDTDPPLRCSNCESEITDDDATCPTCESPIDWGASMAALRAWQKHGVAGPG
jgi:predicted amidophosphoribosyltransferase